MRGERHQFDRINRFGGFVTLVGLAGPDKHGSPRINSHNNPSLKAQRTTADGLRR
jgi:hypothetical protein